MDAANFFVGSAPAAWVAYALFISVLAVVAAAASEYDEKKARRMMEQERRHANIR